METWSRLTKNVTVNFRLRPEFLKLSGGHRFSVVWGPTGIRPGGLVQWGQAGQARVKLKWPIGWAAAEELGLLQVHPLTGGRGSHPCPGFQGQAHGCGAPERSQYDQVTKVLTVPQGLVPNQEQAEDMHRLFSDRWVSCAAVSPTLAHMSKFAVDCCEASGHR